MCGAELAFGGGGPGGNVKRRLIKKHLRSAERELISGLRLYVGRPAGPENELLVRRILGVVLLMLLQCHQLLQRQNTMRPVEVQLLDVSAEVGTVRLNGTVTWSRHSSDGAIRSNEHFRVTVAARARPGKRLCVSIESAG